MQFSYRSDRGRFKSIANSLSSAVLLIPAVLLMSSITRSRETGFFVVIWIACMCIIVVGTIIAIVVMEIWGRTESTSGPWWLGTVTGSSTVASMGPFLISPGSE